MEKKINNKHKKKALLMVSLVVISIFGFFMYQQKQYKNEIEYKYRILGYIYHVMYSPEWEPYTEKNLEEKKHLVDNPPPLEMDGTNGLYVRSQAYYYSTGKEIDCDDVHRMLSEGKIEELYEKYQDYFDWYSMNFFLLNSYSTTIINVSAEYDNNFLDANENYEVYEKNIEKYSNEIEEMMTDWGYPKYTNNSV